MIARHAAIAIAGSIFAVGAAFADGAPKALNETELREVLVGGDVALDESNGAFQESFCPSGDWTLVGVRAPLSGHYTIEGDTVCIEGESAQGALRQCYRFYISDKQYFRRWTESASPEFERVSIQPASC